MKASFEQIYARRKDLERTLLPLAKNLPTTEEADAGFKAFQGGVQGQGQKAAVDSDRAKFAVGGGAMEYLATMERKAYTSLSAEEQAWGTEEDYKNSFWKNNILDERSAEILRQEGIAKGLDWGKAILLTPEGVPIEIDPLSDLFQGQAGGKTRADAFYKRGLQVADAKGDPYS